MSNTTSAEYAALATPITQEVQNMFNSYSKQPVSVVTTFLDASGVVGVTSIASFNTTSVIPPVDVFNLLRVKIDTNSQLASTGVYVAESSIAIDGTKPYNVVPLVMTINTPFVASLATRSTAEYSDLNSKYAGELKNVLLNKYGPNNPLLLDTTFSDIPPAVQSLTNIIFSSDIVINATELRSLVESDIAFPMQTFGGSGLTVDAQTLSVDGLVSPYVSQAIHLRIINRQFVIDLNDVNSAAYKNLSSEVQQGMYAAIHRFHSNLRIVTINRFSPGSVLVESNATFVDAAPLAQTVLNELVASASLPNGLQLDPTNISVNSATPTTASTTVAMVNATATPLANATATPLANATANATATPLANATAVPSANATANATAVPSANATANATAVPSANATANATAVPLANATVNATAVPSANATANATAVPSANATANATAVPSANATANATAVPSANATANATAVPLANATVNATAVPSANATANATAVPLANATVNATAVPLANATANATAVPSANATANATAVPLANATVNATAVPLANATVNATAVPSANATANATAVPLANATANATAVPLANATANATAVPLANATVNATAVPLANATAVPLANATANATAVPLANATANATAVPLANATANATAVPSANATAVPLANATVNATAVPLANATANATAVPLANATANATAVPLANATANATAVPLANATAVPSANATVNATAVPLANATVNATAVPLANATVNATAVPSANATANATAVPLANATANATAVPLANATANATAVPLANATVNATAVPLANATANATAVPLANATVNATAVPSANATVNATAVPSANATANATAVPSANATANATAVPSANATANATAVPSANATANATAVPSANATANATAVPSANATANATAVPSANATANATAVPSANATANATAVPSANATANATAVPSANATANATAVPSANVTANATAAPSANATAAPPTNATANATAAPPTNATANATAVPSANATAAPPTNATANVTATPPTNATANVTATPPTNATAAPPTNSTSTATTVKTSTPTAGPNVAYSVFFKIVNQVFSPDLDNNTSPAYKTLENNIVQQLDQIFRQKYGSKFSRTLVFRFWPGSVNVDAEAIFVNDSPPVKENVLRAFVSGLAPNATIPNTLLQLATSSINVSDATIATLPPLQVNTTFLTINKVYTNALNNNTSSEYLGLSNQINQEVQNMFNSYSVQPVSVMTTFSNISGVVGVTSISSFNTTSLIPPVDVFNLLRTKIDTNSQLASTGVYVKESSIAIDGTKPYNVVPLVMQINTPFMATLANRSSADYGALKSQYAGELNKILQTKYGPNNILLLDTTFSDSPPWLLSSTDVIFSSNTTVNNTELRSLIESTTVFPEQTFGGSNLTVDVTTLSVAGNLSYYATRMITLRILNRDYSTDLTNISSIAYKNLAKAVWIGINDVLKPKHNNLQYILIKAFRSGSVIVDSTAVYANTPPSSQDVVNELTASGVLLGNLQLDAAGSSVDGVAPTTSTTSTTSTTATTIGNPSAASPNTALPCNPQLQRCQSVPAWGIAIIILGIIGIPALILLSVLGAKGHLKLPKLTSYDFKPNQFKFGEGYDTVGTHYSYQGGP
uniref:GPI-anchored protein pfl2 n=1 Tax=Petromyzon marinus TaxID=7757 RepID=A0AAJ7TY18_PETMA|nr:putative GPI-anchored protein pfl2 [Petromyzon marinus]